jgi:hypothetical protein
VRVKWRAGGCHDTQVFQKHSPYGLYGNSMVVLEPEGASADLQKGGMATCSHHRTEEIYTGGLGLPVASCLCYPENVEFIIFIKVGSRPRDHSILVCFILSVGSVGSSTNAIVANPLMPANPLPLVP